MLKTCTSIILGALDVLFCISMDNKLLMYMYEDDTPPLWYAVFKGGLDGTQYAKGRYAVRRNYVISDADIIFYFKKVQFSSRNTTQVTYKVK